MLFTYNALRKDGSNVSGTIEAKDRETALHALSHQGLHPLLVKVDKVSAGSKNITIGNFGKKVSSEDLVVFTRQLSTMISAGVPLVRGLSTLQNSPSSAYFRDVLGKIS